MANEPSASGGRVAGKTALVTGAASGIGRATAVMLAHHGAMAFCADLNHAGVEDTVAAIRAAGSQAESCLLDVTSEAGWLAAIDLVQRHERRLDIAVNCAGISFIRPI